jgi:hypothetical protein
VPAEVQVGRSDGWLLNDRIRLIDLLRKSPAPAGFFYVPISWVLVTLSVEAVIRGDFYGITRRGRPGKPWQHSTPRYMRSQILRMPAQAACSGLLGATAWLSADCAALTPPREYPR